MSEIRLKQKMLRKYLDLAWTYHDFTKRQNVMQINLFAIYLTVYLLIFFFVIRISYESHDQMYFTVLIICALLFHFWNHIFIVWLRINRRYSYPILTMNDSLQTIEKHYNFYFKRFDSKVKSVSLNGLALIVISVYIIYKSLSGDTNFLPFEMRVAFILTGCLIFSSGFLKLRLIINMVRLLKSYIYNYNLIMNRFLILTINGNKL